MLIKNKNSKSGTESMYDNFKRSLASSGKSPEEILNELIKTGKISKQQLNNVLKLANTYRYLIDR